MAVEASTDGIPNLVWDKSASGRHQGLHDVRVDNVFN